MKHCIQYAFVGTKIVCDTENLSDDEVRRVAGLYAAVQRFDRCPVCEVWTRSGGKLRPEIDCPAVKQATAK